MSSAACWPSIDDELVAVLVDAGHRAADVSVTTGHRATFVRVPLLAGICWRCAGAIHTTTHIHRRYGDSHPGDRSAIGKNAQPAAGTADPDKIDFADVAVK